MHERTSKQFGLWLTYVFIGIAAVAMVIGCGNASKLFDKAARKDIVVVAEKCNERFPSTDSVHTQTEYIQGETQVVTDTLWQMVNDTVIKTITYTKYKVDTVRDTKYFKVVDRAKEVVLQAQNAEKDVKIGKLTQRSNTWMWLAIAFMGYFGLKIVTRIWFPTVNRFLI